MITDCHLHSFSKTAAPRTGAYVPPTRDIRDYMDEAAPLGVRRAVVVQASVDGTDNSRLVDVLGVEGPVSLRGVAVIDAAADLPALHAAGIRATRIQDRALLGDSARTRTVSPLLTVVSLTYGPLLTLICPLPA